MARTVSLSRSSSTRRTKAADDGYLRALCTAGGITIEADAGILKLFTQLRTQHAAFAASGPRATDVEKMVRAIGAIIDAFDHQKPR
jgi:hypothetical protein